MNNRSGYGANQALEKNTLSDRVTRSLREYIVSGSLPAGTPLKQEELAMRFGVSMGALREALRTLHSDGLVTLFPNRGATVSDLSAAEAEEIFDIRAILETGALELAWPRLTARCLDAGEKILNRMDVVGDASKWSGLNRQFHERLIAPAARPKLTALLRNLHDNVGRYIRLYLDTLNFQAQSQKEHRQLLTACRAGDLNSAQAILRGHMRGACERLVRHLSGGDSI